MGSRIDDGRALRKLARATLPVLLVALPAGGCASSDGLPDRATVGAAFFPAQVSGNATVTLGGTPGSGSRIDLADDLDLQNDFLAIGRLDLRDGALRLVLDWLPFAFEGSDRLAQDEVFHGTSYSAGDEVASTLDLETWAAKVDTALLDRGDVEVRVGAGVYWWQLDLELEDRTTATTDSRAFSRMLPALTASSWFELGGGFGARLEGSFATLDEGRRLLDAAGQLEYSFDDRFQAFAGWRWLRYWLNEDTNTGLIDVTGPTLGLTLRL